MNLELYTAVLVTFNALLILLIWVLVIIILMRGE